MWGESVIASLPKRGVKRGMLPAVYVILLVFFMGVIFAAPVDAEKLVSNLDQDDSHRSPSSNNYNRANAQKFGVGSTSILEKIVMPIATFSGSPNVSVSIHHVGSDSYPGGKLYSLTGNVNSAGTWNFTAPANASLNASEYFLVFRKQGGNGSFSVTSTFSTAEDSGAADGWSIGNVRHVTYNGRSWLTDGINLRFAVYGEVRDSVVNYPPVFSSGSSFLVNENNRAIGTVVASDNDSLDSVTGYSVSGGFDSGSFSITSGGVFTFRFAPNFESPYGGSNVYDMSVSATSGTGSRVRTTAQGVTVTVVDVDEAPSVPSAPFLSSPNSTSLLVSWSVPSNTGPAISDYDVGYGRNSGGPFTDWPHSGTSRGATITGLNASTLYYVRVLARNAEGSSGWSLTASFTTGSVVNNPPVFTSSSSFSVHENSLRVGNVVAFDRDGADSVTGYSVSGVDSGRFSITGGGVLRFLSISDYENPVDSGGDNVYDLVVTATSGAGGRVRRATQSITVTVNDSIEAPSVPSAPVLSSPSSTSLLVSWSAPFNVGPAISDYDVGYGRNSNGPFTDWSHSGVGRSATITGLNASTLYYVRVLARNAEGSSGWSPTANFTTGSTSVTNDPPVFSSSSSFSVNENTFVVGTVVASDNDGQDNVTGYRVSGGADSGRLLVRNGDLLVFRFAPDYEAPVDVGGDNVYNFVVTATSGTGGRVRTATQSIVVTVVDVDEGGGKPVIGGTFGYRQVLTVDTSGIRDVNGIPDGFDSFKWYRTNGSDPDFNYDSIDGASDMTYRVSYEDLGEHLWVEVSYLDGVGRRHYLLSDSTGEVPFPNLVEGSSSRLVSNMGQFSNSSDSHSVVRSLSVIQEFTTGGSFDYVLEKVVLNVYENSSDSPSVYIYTQNSFDPFVILSGNVDSLGRKEFTAPPGSFLKGNVTYSVRAEVGRNSLYSLWSTSSGDEDSGAASGWSISNVTVSPTSSFPLKIEVHGRSRDFPDVNLPPPVNNPPVFTSNSTFSVNENVRGVGTVVASDLDNQDGVSGYSVSGGVDSARFSITSGGVLSFVSVPNYENPQDTGTDNVYALEVEVTSGTDSRVRTATQTITVAVVDVDEAPSAPGRPVLGSPSSTSLLVSWSAPGGTGPSIIDYDVGYGRSSSGPFTDWSHSDASRSATITGLNASTLYYVRVRAVNAEGSSGWSPTANFTTGSPPVNNPPVFSSSSSFSVNENVRGVGTVVASDLDNRDAVSGYVVSGGVDSARFSITNSGVLTFNSAPNYESPVDSGGDNVYDLVVTVTSGAGGRVRTATQSISVTVNDVVEAPSAPSVPVLSSPSSTSLLVSWSVPSNKGPVIDDYDVGYGRSSSGPFTDWSHSGNSTTATITGLNASTLYYVRVLARNVEGSSGWSPTASFTTGSTSVPNNPPVFSGNSSSTTINENSVDVGVVGAVDIDPRDDVTGYSVGGVDSAFFSITDYGELTFSSAPDFEVPVDSGGDNVYNVVVTATSGTGSRVRTATHNVTVTVLDVVEAPSAPSAPVLSSPSSTSLSVSWSVPSNTGPAISGYDVEYRQGTSGSFSGWLHSGTGTSATITGLDASTLYQVQVRAGNAEGNSSWSEVSNFTTGSVSLFPPPNNPPVFSSSSSFSVNENNRAVGTVVASDRDSLDSVSGYRVSGGADSARFSITNSGVLTFRSAPDYESPVDSDGDNVYDLVVTATSGTGSRVRTATQSVTVTVNDVDEMVSVIPPQDVVLVYRCV